MSLSIKEEDKLEEVNLQHSKNPNQLESTQIIIKEALNTLGYPSEVFELLKRPPAKAGGFGHKMS